MLNLIPLESPKNQNPRSYLQPTGIDCNSSSINRAKTGIFIEDQSKFQWYFISIFQVVGREKYGVFPLRGKLLNVSELTPGRVWF